MKLKSIHLKNIKSHKELTVNFTDGITAILGRNGVGKTTILESIGFVLFDYMPYKNQKEFITHGKTWGEIELTIELGEPSNPITISRRIGNNPHYKIGDIVGKEDVQAWIRDKLKIDMDLERLYSEILAIPQGLATAHFLLPKTARMQIFDSILGVDVYRDCWTKLSKVERLCKDKIDLVEDEIKLLERDTKDYDEGKDKLSNINNEKNKIGNDILETDKKIRKLGDKIIKMKKLESLDSERKWLDMKKIDLEDDIESTQKQLSQIKFDENRKKEIKSEIQPYMNANKKHFETMRDIDKLEYEISDADEYIQEYKNQIDEFENDMKDYNTISILSEKFNALLDKMNRIEQKITITKTKLNDLENFRLNDTCPLTGKSCPEIDKVNIREEIDEYTNILDNLNKQLSIIRNDYNESYRAKQIKEKLDEKSEHIKELKSLLTKNETIVNKNTKDRDLLMQSLTRIKDDLEIYDKLKQEYDEIKSNEQANEIIKSQLEKLNEEYRDIITKIDAIPKEIEDFDEDKLIALQDESIEVGQYLSKLEERLSQNAKERLSQAYLIGASEKRLKKLEEYRNIYIVHEKTLEKIKKIRDVFKNVGSKLVNSYLQDISYEANNIFQEFDLKNSSNGLVWQDDYNIKVGNENFNQLSGAEQKCAAISIRMALLKYLSNIHMIIIDEPTGELDEENVDSLSESLKNLEGYGQILVVTHNKKFSEIAENIINLD